MSNAVSSKDAQAHLINPLNAPEPAADTGLNAHFGSTFAPAANGAVPASKESKAPNVRVSEAGSSSAKPHRSDYHRKSPSPGKNGVTSTVRSSPNGRKERFPDYRAEAFQDVDEQPRRNRATSHGTPPSYQEATSNGNSPNPTGRRRGSSLKERFPGDKGSEPLNVIRKDSRKAYRSAHLRKEALPGADSIDKLDPAIGGRAYHHEGPYDAAMLARNRNPKHAPIGALEDSNREAIRATPQENIKNAVERHRPLEGVADVPPGERDRFGRVYNYQEGTDMMRETASAAGDPGYKRWGGKDYDPDDVKGESEPTFSLDRALRAHNINETSEGGIEMQDRAHQRERYREAQRKGKLDDRDPVDIAGGEGRYVDMEVNEVRAEASASDARRRSHGGTMDGLKKRIGSLKHRHRDE